jgi:tRNA threonylcarbamoyladenosine biosynthesis protein TsaE
MKVSFTINNISKACKAVWDAGKSKKVWAFYGEMGAGKTTFIHHLCELIGVTSTISSPTYALINEYECKDATIIYHMDWYRLKSEQEAIEAGIEDCLYSGNFCLVEWPQKAEGLLPDDVFKITIKLTDSETREIAFGN